MIDLDKYKQSPYEIEGDTLSALPMKDMLELVKYLHNLSKEIYSQMNIHKINLDKIQAGMQASVIES